ncbi:MAG: hypothetical protein PHW83_07225 [Bacteroidales bacterium]|nr:hypothetical protein [Bacteroidales bacterium]
MHIADIQTHTTAIKSEGTSQENISSVNSQKYYWKYDGHHNAAGYEKFANGVYWKLKQMNLQN